MFAIKKIRLGIDIDGTITDPSSFLPHLNKDFNKNLTLDDLFEYDLTNVLEISEHQFSSWMKQNEAIVYQNSLLADDCKQVLCTWENNFELYFISARPQTVHDLTLKWFKEMELPFDHIELIGSHDKRATIKNHDIDVFFEDKHDNAVAIAEDCNIPVILMDTPYNREDIPEHVYRAYNWREAENLVKEIFNL